MLNDDTKQKRMDTGIVLRLLRLRANVSSVEVVRSVGISAERLSRLEMGSQVLSFDEGAALCKFYGVPLNKYLEVREALLKAFHDVPIQGNEANSSLVSEASDPGQNPPPDTNADIPEVPRDEAPPSLEDVWKGHRPSAFPTTTFQST